MLPNFSYMRATTVAEAVRALASPGARLHAGGTDLLGCLRDRAMEADKLVSLAGIASLRGIAAPAAGGLRIGAMTPLSEVASHKAVLDAYPALAQAAASVASPQLRNQGTLGGNLCQRPRCWYFRGDFACARKGGGTCFAAQGENQHHAIFGGGSCFIVHPSDTATALTALSARLRVTGPGGVRLVPIGAFFVLPEKNVRKENVLERGEIVTDILLPPAPAGMRSSYRKVRSRGSWDFALAALALAFTFDSAGTVKSARVVLGAAAPIPWRVEAVEKLLVGTRLTPELATRAAEAAVRGAEAMARNAYKIRLFRGIVEEQLLAMAS
ncbi:MAG: FAD binding domain-containing protein [Bacteroidales bacterium]